MKSLNKSKFYFVHGVFWDLLFLLKIHSCCLSMSLHRVYHYFKLSIFNSFIVTFYVSMSECFQFFTIQYGAEMYVLITWWLQSYFIDSWGLTNVTGRTHNPPLEEGSQKTREISHKWTPSTASSQKNQASSKIIIHKNAARHEYYFLSF